MQLEHNLVREIVSRYGQTSVSAHQFFVSWHSVVTLAYSGFSRTLLAVKRGIEEGIPGLKPENPGSKWPKTTLGCLREGVQLTEYQVGVLRGLCVQQSALVQEMAESDRAMDVLELRFVTFHCRTLERRLISQAIPHAGRACDDDRPPQSHLESVAGTMAQFNKENHAKYYPKLAPKDRTIDIYYRAPHVESTLVYDLKPSAPLIDIIDNFRSAVDEAIPDFYAWFDPTSWHMTVRALVSEE